MPWTLSGASVLFLYWRKSGGLEKTLSVMDDSLPYYVTLAGGHGAGGACILRAEASLLRGDDSEAEILCHKAIYEASAAGQTGNCLCAELLLARVAILRGDYEAYTSIRQNIVKRAKEANQTSMLRIGDLCLAHTDLALGRQEDLPSWLRDAESIRKVVYADGQPYALMLHGMALLRERRYEELYCIAESVKDVARRMNYLLPQVYYSIYLAAAKSAQGRRTEALPHLKEALSLALPDRVYLPFAEHEEYLTPLLQSLRGDLPTEETATLLELCTRQTAGTDAIRRALSGTRSPLSDRQREIALLLKEGLSVKKIADKLFITENTVKSITKTVYGKLGVHSRIELIKISL